VSPQEILTAVTTSVVVGRSADSAGPHSTCFSTTISTSKKIIFSERDQERDTLTRATLSGFLSTMAN